MSFIGAGTVLNVVAILLGSSIGVALGSRLREKTRNVVTDGMGLTTLLVAALSAAAIIDPELRAALTSGAVLVVLAALVIGGLLGSWLGIEERLEQFGSWLQGLFVRKEQIHDGPSFIEGFVTASLVFCVGPLAILGAVSDGIGTGIEQLAVKSALDFVACIAFAAALGWGVAASAIPVAIYQGAWTVIGVFLGGVLPPAQIAVITATGGLLLIGVGLRIMRIKAVPVADLLPSLIIAPLLLWGVTTVIS